MGQPNNHSVYHLDFPDAYKSEPRLNNELIKSEAFDDI
jgi:hypothetical protein